MLVCHVVVPGGGGVTGVTGVEVRNSSGKTSMIPLWCKASVMYKTTFSKMWCLCVPPGCSQPVPQVRSYQQDDQGSGSSGGEEFPGIPMLMRDGVVCSSGWELVYGHAIIDGSTAQRLGLSGPDARTEH